MSCEHKRLQPEVSFVDMSTDDKSIIVDVWCADCGESAGVLINPASAQWEPQEEQTKCPHLNHWVDERCITVCVDCNEEFGR